METVKLFDSEARLMDVLWARGTTTARELAQVASEQFGWNKNTTYTVLKRLVAKSVIGRTDPGFVCRPLVNRKDVGREEAAAVVRSYFGGSVKALFSSFMASGDLSGAEAEEMRRLIDEYEAHPDQRQASSSRELGEQSRARPRGRPPAA